MSNCVRREWQSSGMIQLIKLTDRLKELWLTPWADQAERDRRSGTGKARWFPGLCDTFASWGLDQLVKQVVSKVKSKSQGKCKKAYVGIGTVSFFEQEFRTRRSAVCPQHSVYLQVRSRTYSGGVAMNFR